MNEIRTDRIDIIEASLERYRRGMLNPDKAAENIVEAVEILTHVSHVIPELALNKSGLVLIHKAQSLSVELVKNFSYFLTKLGKLEPVFNLVPDPQNLSNAVSYGYSSAEDTNSLATSKEALRLGGVPSYSSLSSARFEEMSEFPDLGMTVTLVENIGRYLERLPEDSSLFISNLMNMLKSLATPEHSKFVSEFIDKHKEVLSERLCNYGVFGSTVSPIARVYSHLLKSTLQSHELYCMFHDADEAGYSEYLKNAPSIYLISSAIESPSFDVTKLPKKPGLGKKFCMAAVEYGITTRISDQSYDRIETVWGRICKNESLIDAVVGGNLKGFMREVKIYKEWLAGNPSFESMNERAKLRDVEGAANIDWVERKLGLKNPIGADPKLSNLHQAYCIISGNYPKCLEKPEPLSALAMKAIIFRQGDRTYENLAREAFENPENREALRSLEESAARSLARRAGLDESVLRKINWKSTAFKKTLLDQDLGI